jgi:hypothetical protein
MSFEFKNEDIVAKSILTFKFLKENTWYDIYTL